MIDLSDLTDDQKNGLAFGTQQFNAGMPIGSTPLTVEQYCKLLLKNSADTFFSALAEYKKQITIEAFYAAPAEKQQQVFDILEVQDVLT